MHVQFYQSAPKPHNFLYPMKLNIHPDHSKTARFPASITCLLFFPFFFFFLHLLTSSTDTKYRVLHWVTHTRLRNCRKLTMFSNLKVWFTFRKAVHAIKCCRWLIEYWVSYYLNNYIQHVAIKFIHFTEKKKTIQHINTKVLIYGHRIFDSE